jgi:hypothetical protein
LDFGHRNLGFKPGTSEFFNRFFFGTFHKMKKFKRHFSAYKISDFFYVNLKISKKFGDDF